MYMPGTRYGHIHLTVTSTKTNGVSSRCDRYSFRTRNINQFAPVRNTGPTVNRVGRPRRIRRGGVRVVIRSGCLTSILRTLCRTRPCRRPICRMCAVGGFRHRCNLKEINGLTLPVSLHSFVRCIGSIFRVRNVHFVTTSLSRAVDHITVYNKSTNGCCQGTVGGNTSICVANSICCRATRSVRTSKLAIVSPNRRVRRVYGPGLLRLFAR